MDIIIGILAGIIALIFAFYLVLFIKKQDVGTKEMKDISDAIYKGAMTFLNKEYRILVVFVIAVAIILAIVLPDNGLQSSLAFVIGAICSALAGNIGMRVATMSNARAAQGVKHSLNKGLRIAFSSGTVMGMCVVGLGILGICGVYSIMHYGFDIDVKETTDILFSFGFGASSIALFARVGGGIYTKSADVGADLVGKVEAGIPEDDPRNPAVIADNVGDNVGDVAGMGADLFESYVDSIIATMALGAIAAGFAQKNYGENAVMLPIVLAGFGIFASIIATFFVRTGPKSNIYTAMRNGLFGGAIIMAIFSAIICWIMVESFEPFYAMLTGLGAGIVIGLATEYFTSEKQRPAQKIAEASETGAATNIIEGIATGMMSTVIPVISVCVAMGLAYHFADIYGIAISAVGMLSTLGISLATDCYGPVADNAAGIAEMAHLGDDVREKAESLDAVGNTTAAMSKGFAIGSAAITALALMTVYAQTAGINTINLTETKVMIGLFIGALLPFLFTAMTMGSVGKAANEMVEEVRRQFREIPGLMEGKAKPDFERCIEISTTASLKEMIIPGLMTVIIPVVIGVGLGPEALGGMLAGAISAGFLLGIFLANSGGAWDNAKKYIESGHLGGKGSDAHKAAVVGDTVGDPCKDTSGPSLNILIKLMSIVSLVFIPLF